MIFDIVLGAIAVVEYALIIALTLPVPPHVYVGAALQQRALDGRAAGARAGGGGGGMSSKGKERRLHRSRR